MNNADLSFLIKLTEAFGPSGCEDEVRDLIARRIQGRVSKLFSDPLGNLIAVKGTGGSVVLSAHMDEVAFMATSFHKDGTLRFDQVGGITAKNLPSKRVCFPKKNVTGVIGAVPIHLRGKNSSEITYRDLVIDIGAADEKEAALKIEKGDLAVFDTQTHYFEHDGGILMGKAMDDRLGCYLLCALIENDAVPNATFVFTVQEETGLLGASAAVGNLPFHYGIALDVTTPNDLPGVSGPKTVCRLRKGPVISYADGRTLYDRDSVMEIFTLLEKAGIPCQTKAIRAGGNEAFSFQNAGDGMIAISVSVPCRYIHGPMGILAMQDLDATMKALPLILGHLEEKEKKHD